MLMSHGARSAAEIGCPKPGPCCAAACMPPNSAAAAPTVSKRALRKDIADLPAGRDVPSLNAVVVVVLAFAVLAHEARTRRLHRAGIVDRAAHEHRGASAPTPWQPKARERLR